MSKSFKSLVLSSSLSSGFLLQSESRAASEDNGVPKSAGVRPPVGGEILDVKSAIGAALASSGATASESEVSGEPAKKVVKTALPNPIETDVDDGELEKVSEVSTVPGSSTVNLRQFAYMDDATLGGEIQLGAADAKEAQELWSNVGQLYDLVHANQNQNLIKLPPKPEVHVPRSRRGRWQGFGETNFSGASMALPKRYVQDTSLSRESIFSATPGYYDIDHNPESETYGKRTGLYAQLREKILNSKLTDYANKAVGTMIGMAIGDSLGAPLEFMPAQDYARNTGVDHESDPQAFAFLNPEKGEIEYKNPTNAFGLSKGQYTDDTSMGVVMADNLILHNIAHKGLAVPKHEAECANDMHDFNAIDARLRWWNWWNRGYGNAFQNTSNKAVKNIGLDTRKILNRAKEIARKKIAKETATGSTSSIQTGGTASSSVSKPIPNPFHAKIRQETYAHALHQYGLSDVVNRIPRPYDREYAFPPKIDPHTRQPIMQERVETKLVKKSSPIYDPKDARPIEMHVSVGLGGNISKGFQELALKEKIDPFRNSGSEDAGNGSIMRLAPIPIVSSGNLERGLEIAGQASYATHPGVIAAECSKLWTYVVGKAIEYKGEGMTVQQFIDQTLAEYKLILEERVRQKDPNLVTQYLIDTESRKFLRDRYGRAQLKPGTFDRDIARSVMFALVAGKRKLITDRVAQRLITEKEGVTADWRYDWSKKHIIKNTYEARQRDGTYNGYPVLIGYFGSYAPDAIGMALNAIYHTDNAQDALLKLVNFRGDSDSTAAVGGQLIGAWYGYHALATAFPEYVDRMQDGPTYLAINNADGSIEQRHDNKEMYLRALMLAYLNKRYPVYNKKPLMFTVDGIAVTAEVYKTRKEPHPASAERRHPSPAKEQIIPEIEKQNQFKREEVRQKRLAEGERSFESSSEETTSDNHDSLADSDFSTSDFSEAEGLEEGEEEEEEDSKSDLEFLFPGTGVEGETEEEKVATAALLPCRGSRPAAPSAPEERK